jgi:excisionase family DNA binding protein
LAEIMNTKDVSEYPKLYEITICKCAVQGKIPAIRIGKVWRFDKEVIDRWITGGQKQIHTKDNKVRGDERRESGKKRLGKRKG